MNPNSIEARLEKLGWNAINQELQKNGFAVIKTFLSEFECEELKIMFNQDEHYRSTIDMKRFNFGTGSYRYFKYPLPDMVQSLREGIYEKVSATANAWSERLNCGIEYPAKFSEFARIMREKRQTKPTPLILRYSKDDFNCLHQDIANDLTFPYQVVLGLSENGKDYEGGHFVLTQQRPRMQTVPHVLTIPIGGAVIFSSNFHPQIGKRGFYRTVFKHGVSKIESGDRYTVGVVFHDYLE